jgi:L-threonate 2-dehydrogenase
MTQIVGQQAGSKVGLKVGMIGLGIMGGAMARNLVDAGFKVFGFDLDAKAVAAAKAGGVDIASSAVAVAEAASDIFVCLPSPKAVAETAKAIAAGTAKNRTVIELSTLTLADKMVCKDVLEAAGHTVLDCPLSGTGAQAQTRDLVVMASGDAAAIQRLDPVFLAFARKVQNVGVYGHGSKMKFVANLLVAINNVATAEAMVLGMKAGLDPHQMVDVISSGAANSRIFELRAPMMANNDYMPATMRSRTWKKDMTVIGDFASSLDCPTPLFDATAGIYDAALAMGHGAEDVAAVCAVLETMAGLKR